MFSFSACLRFCFFAKPLLVLLLVSHCVCQQVCACVCVRYIEAFAYAFVCVFLGLCTKSEAARDPILTRTNQNGINGSACVRVCEAGH